MTQEKMDSWLLSSSVEEIAKALKVGRATVFRRHAETRVQTLYFIAKLEGADFNYLQEPYDRHGAMIGISESTQKHPGRQIIVLRDSSENPGFPFPTPPSIALLELVVSTSIVS